MGAFSSVASVVEEILALKNSDRILVCCMLWRWWLARNKLNSEGVHVALESVIRQARYIYFFFDFSPGGINPHLNIYI
jgi:hypothetical protein